MGIDTNRKAKDRSKSSVQSIEESGRGLIWYRLRCSFSGIHNARDILPSKHEHESAHHTTEDNKETVFATKTEGEGLDTGRSNTLA